MISAIRLSKNKIAVSIDINYTETPGSSLAKGQIHHVGTGIPAMWLGKHVVFSPNKAHFVSNEYGWVLDFSDVLFEVD